MISIVIPTWNGCHLLQKSIPSLVNQLTPDSEIIVVDNGSTDGTSQWLRTFHPSVRIVELNENKGFSVGVNAGITAAGNKDIILVNNDTEALPGWFDALIQALEKYPDYHIFASRVTHLQPPHLIDTVGDGFTIAGFGYKIGWMQPDDMRFDEPREVFGASGCAMLIRREVLRAIGGFDPEFFAFGEDIDFCFRARLQSYRVLYVPEARIRHAVRATAPAMKTLFWYHRNLIWTLIKNLPAALGLLYGPHILLHIVLVIVRSATGGWFRVYCRSLSAAVCGIPGMLRKRAVIQSSRSAALWEIRRQLDANWIRVHLDLHRAKKRSWNLRKILDGTM